MPYIELPPCVNGNHDNAAKHLLGIMLFPRSKRKRATLAQAFDEEFLLILLKNNPDIPLDPLLAIQLAKHKSPRAIMEEAGEELGRDSTLSGAILMLSIWTAPEIASLKLSMEALYTAYNNKIRGVSKNTQREAWKKFRTVSHLWAAHQIFLDVFPENATHFPCHESQLHLFLTLAEDIREKGERFKPQRTRKKEYILDRTKTWKLHPSIQLDSWHAFLKILKIHPFIKAVISERSQRYKPR